MVNRMIESVKMAQENVGLLKYPALIVGSTIIANKLFKWNKERKCVLKTTYLKKLKAFCLEKSVGRLFIRQPIKRDISLFLEVLDREKLRQF